MAGLSHVDESIQAREIDFVERFASNWQALREIMGIMRPIRKAPGTRLVSYNATMTLEDGNVAEGEVIPYSEAYVTEVAHDDLTLEKYAKAVSIEQVNRYGAQLAIQKTDDAFLRELQSRIMNKFYAFVQTGTLTAYADGFQVAVAKALGLATDKFKKIHRDVSSLVVFVNTLDLYDYYGTANIDIQTAAGIQYIKNFMGANTVIISSEIPRDVVIAVPTENIVLYYADPADSEFAQLGLNYTVQGETNLIGFHANGNYSTAVGESFALMGMTLWAEYLDGIAVVTVGSETKGSQTVTLAEAGSELTLSADDFPVDENNEPLANTNVTIDRVQKGLTIYTGRDLRYNYQISPLRIDLLEMGDEFAAGDWVVSYTVVTTEHDGGGVHSEGVDAAESIIRP